MDSLVTYSERMRPILHALVILENPVKQVDLCSIHVQMKLTVMSLQVYQNVSISVNKFRPASIPLRIVPWLVEDMVSMSSDTLAPEQDRESQSLRYLVFGDDVIGTFRLSNDELSNLRLHQQVHSTILNVDHDVPESLCL